MTGTEKLDPRILAARNHAVNQCDMIEVATDPTEAKAHAAGLILGARDYLISKYGTRDTYELMQQMADSTINPALTAANIETELAQLLRGRKAA